MLAHGLRFDVAEDAGEKHRVGELQGESRVKGEIREILVHVAHQVDSVEERVVLDAGLEHDLVAVAFLALVAPAGRSEGAGAHHDTLGRRGRDYAGLPCSSGLDERSPDVFIRAGRTYAGGNVGVVPKASAAVHVTGEHSRNVRTRGDGPGKKSLRGIGRIRGNDVQGIFRTKLRMVEKGELTEGQAVAVRNLRRVRLAVALRHGAFNDTPRRVHVVDDVERRRVVTEVAEGFHQSHHVLRVVEIAHSDILYLDDDGIESAKFVRSELYVVRERGEFRVARGEYRLKVAAQAEYVIHILAGCRVPAVLGAEAADLSVNKSLVQLFLKRCCPE